MTTRSPGGSTRTAKASHRDGAERTLDQQPGMNAGGPLAMGAAAREHVQTLQDAGLVATIRKTRGDAIDAEAIEALLEVGATGVGAGAAAEALVADLRRVPDQGVQRSLEIAAQHRTGGNQQRGQGRGEPEPAGGGGRAHRAAPGRTGPHRAGPGSRAPEPTGRPRCRPEM